MAWEAVNGPPTPSLPASHTPCLTHQAPAAMGLPSAARILQAHLTSGLCPEHLSSRVSCSYLPSPQILAQIPLPQQALP